MLETRLRSYQKYSRVRATLVTRSADLLSMEGWYQVTSENPYFLRYLNAESKLSFSRWLLKSEGLHAIAVSKIVKQVASENTSIKVSCRFNDLLRAADSPHYRSCMAPNNVGDGVPIILIKDPTAAIAYTPDNGGFFLGRAIFTLRSKRIKIFRCYGTFNHPMLTRFFKKNFPQYDVDPFEHDTVSDYLFGG